MVLRGKTWTGLPALFVLMWSLSGTAGAAYGEECRALAERLDREPASLAVGELDLFKNCLGDLQRIIALGETPPAPKSLPAPTLAPAQECPPPPEPEPCPVCKVCPAEPPAARKRERDREEDKLRPVLTPF